MRNLLKIFCEIEGRADEVGERCRDNEFITLMMYEIGDLSRQGQQEFMKIKNRRKCGKRKR